MGRGLLLGLGAVGGRWGMSATLGGECGDVGTSVHTRHGRWGTRIREGIQWSKRRSRDGVRTGRCADFFRVTAVVGLEEFVTHGGRGEVSF